MTSSQGSAPMRHRARMLAAATLAGALFWGTSATAVSYFDGPSGYGFDNEGRDEPLAPTYRILSSDDWLPAGSARLKGDDDQFALLISAKQKLKPRKKNGREFLRIKVKWRIENATDEELERAILFVSALSGPQDGYPDYSDVPINMLLGRGKSDQRRMDIITYDDGVNRYDFAGFVLENLAPGASKKVIRKFKYDVLDDELVDNRGPAFGVAAVFNAVLVPEPTTTLLLLAAAGWLVWPPRR